VRIGAGGFSAPATAFRNCGIPPCVLAFFQQPDSVLTQPQTSRFAEYVAPARPRSQFWRLLVGLVLCVTVYIGMTGALFGLLILLVGWDQAANLALEVTEARTPTAALALLFTFVGMGLGPVVAVHLLHRRSAASLFGPRARVLRDFLLTAAIVGSIYALSMVLWSVRHDAVPQLNPALWLSFLPLAIVGLLIQTGAEEMLFRGYLMQQLAARFRSPVIWMILPSVVFGAVHFDPATAGGNAWIVIAAAGLFGLVAADLTAVTGSLGAAWGFHFANNFAALLVVAVDGTIPGLALYLTPYAADDVATLRPLVLVDLISLAAAWYLARRMLRR
jgi:membrane protease YdiL (CAAX protease family)